VSENWWSYVVRVGAGFAMARAKRLRLAIPANPDLVVLSVKEIAEGAGVDPSQVSRWKNGRSAPRAENVIRFARTYGADPLEALVAGGFLTPAEAGASITVRSGIGEFADDELITELQARLKTRTTAER
jgi:transcriptional regulator with XRE-family HTH domain